MQDERQRLLVAERQESRNSRASQHWLRLRLVLKAITLLKHPQVEVVLDLDQLACDVENTPFERQNSKRTGLSYAVSDYRLLESLFSRIARGSEVDLNEVDNLLGKDESEGLAAREGAHRLVNRRSMAGKTLLYEAATQGNLAGVQLLLRHGANPSQKSKADGELETSLEAACRWGHVQVAELLLNQHKWTKDELKAAQRVARNPQLKSSVNRVLGKAKHSCCCLS
jgi:hypothetical protein